MMKLFLLLLALVFSAATQELKEKSIIVNKSTETKTMRDDDEDPPPPPPPDQKINTNETQSQKVDKTKEVPITVKENETVGNGTKRTSGGKKARTITRKQKQKNEKSPTKESWSNPITVQDGEVIDYGNGTVVRISRVEKSRIIKQNQNQPNEKSPRLEIWRRLIEETIGKIVNNTIRPQYDGILKEIRTIKDKQQNIDNKIGVIEKSQKDFSDRIIKERDLDRNATKQFQSALEAIQNNQQTMKDDLSKSMVNTTNKIANQLEGNLIKQEKERGRIHEALSKIDNDIKNVESEIKNKVEPVQNIVARGLKDINEREKNKTNVNIEEIMKKILEKEMAVVQMFSKNVSQNMDKIQKLSNDSNKSILKIKEQLTKGIESINKDNGLNGQKLVNDVHAVIHENGALFQNALSLAQKQSHNDIIDTKYKLIKELQNLNTELHKRLKEQNDTINGAKKVILSDIWNIKEDLTKHKKDQKTFLELILRIQETIREDIKNATYEKMKNVPFVEIEKYIENARRLIEKHQTDTVKNITRKVESSGDKTRYELYQNLNKLLKNLTTKLENVSQTTANDLKKEINASSKDLLRKNDFEIKHQTDTLNQLIKSLGTKDADNEFSTKMNDQHENILKILKTIEDNLERNRGEVFLQLKNISDSLNNRTDGEGFKNISKNLNNIMKELVTLKHIQEDALNFDKNLHPHLKNHTSEISRDFSKILNKSVSNILNDFKKNNNRIQKKLEEEVDKILMGINDAKIYLSQKLSDTENKTGNDLLNRTKNILELVNNIKDDQSIIKNLLNNDPKIGNHQQLILSMRKILWGIDDIRKENKKIVETDENILKEFINTNNHIEKAIVTSKMNGKETQKTTENLGKNILRELLNLQRAVNEYNKKLSNNTNGVSQDNSTLKRDIIKRIDELEKTLQRGIDNAGTNISNITPGVLNMLEKTKQHLSNLISDNGRNISRVMRNGIDDTNKNIENVKNKLSKNMRSVIRETQKSINDGKLQILDELHKVNESLSKGINVNRKEFAFTKNDFDKKFNIVRNNQKRLFQTIKETETNLLERFNKTDKRILKIKKDLFKYGLKRKLKSIKSEKDKVDEILENIKGNKDLITNANQKIEKFNRISKAIKLIGRNQKGLKKHILKIKQNLKQNNKQILEAELIKTQVQANGRSIQDQLRISRDILGNVNSTKKYISNLRNEITQDIDKIKENIDKSKGDITGVENRLLNEIKKSKRKIIKKIEDPKQIKHIERLIKKRASKILRELKKARGDIRRESNETLKNTDKARTNVVNILNVIGKEDSSNSKNKDNSNLKKDLEKPQKKDQLIIENNWHNSETNKDKGDTRIINRNDEDAFEKTENKDHRRNTGIDWDDNGTNNWDDNKTNKDQNDSLKNRIKDQLKETLKEDRLERTEKDPVKDTGLDWDDNETNKDKGNTQDKTNQDDYDKTENKDPGWRYYTKSARSKKDIPKTTFKKWDLKARILDTLGKNL